MINHNHALLSWPWAGIVVLAVLAGCAPEADLPGGAFPVSAAARAADWPRLLPLAQMPSPSGADPRAAGIAAEAQVLAARAAALRARAAALAAAPVLDGAERTRLDAGI